MDTVQLPVYVPFLVSISDATLLESDVLLLSDVYYVHPRVYTNTFRAV